MFDGPFSGVGHPGASAGPNVPLQNPSPNWNKPLLKPEFMGQHPFLSNNGMMMPSGQGAVPLGQAYDAHLPGVHPPTSFTLGNPHMDPNQQAHMMQYIQQRYPAATLQPQ